MELKKHVLSEWNIYALDWTSADPQQPFSAFRIRSILKKKSSEMLEIHYRFQKPNIFSNHQ